MNSLELVPADYCLCPQSGPLIVYVKNSVLTVFVCVTMAKLSSFDRHQLSIKTKIHISGPLNESNPTHVLEVSLFEIKLI